MDKIAVLSDIHGNLEALKTCLEDIDERGITHIICLGDIVAKGVHPKECLKLLKERNAIMIRGNCDRYFSCEYKEEEKNDRIRFNQAMLSKEDRTYLNNLPFSYEMMISGSLVRFLHASPTKDANLICRIHSLEDEYQMFLPSEYTSHKIADVVIYGHTHTPYFHKAYHHTLINAGSVGNSVDVYQDSKHIGNYEETARAVYLIIEGYIDSKERKSISYNHVFLPYDIEKELSSPKFNNEKEAYENELRYGKYRDIQKLKL